MSAFPAIFCMLVDMQLCFFLCLFLCFCCLMCYYIHPDDDENSKVDSRLKMRSMFRNESGAFVSAGGAYCFPAVFWHQNGRIN